MTTIEKQSATKIKIDVGNILFHSSKYVNMLSNIDSSYIVVHESPDRVIVIQIMTVPNKKTYITIGSVPIKTVKEGWCHFDKSYTISEGNGWVFYHDTFLSFKQSCLRLIGLHNEEDTIRSSVKKACDLLMAIKYTPSTMTSEEIAKVICA